MGKKTVRGHDIANRFVYSLRALQLQCPFVVCKTGVSYFTDNREMGNNMSVIPAYISGCHIGSGCSCRDIFRGYTIPKHVEFRCAAGESSCLFPKRLLTGCLDNLVCLIKSVTLRCMAGDPCIRDPDSLGIKKDLKSALSDFRM